MEKIFSDHYVLSDKERMYEGDVKLPYPDTLVGLFLFIFAAWLRCDNEGLIIWGSLNKFFIFSCLISHLRPNTN